MMYSTCDVQTSLWKNNRSYYKSIVNLIDFKSYYNIYIYNNKNLKEFCADIVSVLAMTISEKREWLKYRFLSSKELVGSWGHEYVRHLTAQLTQE